MNLTKMERRRLVVFSILCGAVLLLVLTNISMWKDNGKLTEKLDRTKTRCQGVENRYWHARATYTNEMAKLGNTLCEKEFGSDYEFFHFKPMMGDYFSAEKVVCLEETDLCNEELGDIKQMDISVVKDYGRRFKRKRSKIECR